MAKLNIIILAIFIGIILGYGISELTTQPPIPEEKEESLMQLDNPREVEMKIVAIDDNNQGVTSTLITEIQPGNGLILVNINDVLADLSTQLSARTAAQYASKYVGVESLENLDIIYTIKANASIIGGPSAGSAMAVATILALEEKQPRKDVIITGSIDELGNIKSVGSIPEKAEATVKAGASLFLIPEGNTISNILTPERKCTDYKDMQYCVIEYKPKEINIDSEIEIKEVSTVKEAIQFFRDEKN